MKASLAVIIIGGLVGALVGLYGTGKYQWTVSKCEYSAKPHFEQKFIQFFSIESLSNRRCSNDFDICSNNAFTSMFESFNSRREYTRRI